MNKYELSKDRLGYTQRYMTFGFSTIEYPMEQITKAATYKYIENSLREWLKNTGAPLNYAYERLLLKDGDYKTEGSIYHALLKEANVMIHGQSVQTMNIVDMINNIITNAFGNFKDNEYDTSYIIGLLDSIDFGFKDNNPLGAEYGIGSVRAVIRENERILKSEFGGWGYRIKEALLTLMFENRDGLRLVKELIATINSSFDGIAIKNTNEQSYMNIRKEIEATCAEIERLRTDGWLKFGGLQKWPIEQRINKCRKKITSYVDARLNVCAINAAKKLVSRDDEAALNFGLRKSIDDFASRIEMFENGIVEWITSLSVDYDDIVSPKALNGHIVWRDRIAAIANDLIVTAGKNMFDITKGSLSDSFRERLIQDSNTSTESIFVKKKDKSAIIKYERSNFMNLSKDKKVIEEFLKEEQDRTEGDENSNDTIININAKADIFLDISERDSNTIKDDNTLFKKWFFYPDGQSVSNACDYTINPFAIELHNRQLVNNWTEQSQDSSDDRIILFLQEKAGFPLRYLNMIHEPQMQDALNEAHDMASVGINTFISRVDVDFMSLRIINAAKLNQVKVLFIESIATGKLTLKNHEFIYGQESKVNIFDFGAQESIKLPEQYKNAVYKLYKNEGMQERLRNDNDKYVNENLVDFLQSLHTLLYDFRVYGLVLTDAEKNEIYRLIVEEYIKPKGIGKQWDELFPDTPIPEEIQQFFKYVAQINPDDLKHPRIGWYCSACGQFMGDVRINGEPDTNAANKFRQIHVCSR